MLAVPAGTAKSVGLYGDSITAGDGDDNQHGGWARRALDPAGESQGLATRIHTTLPYVDSSMPGDTICNLVQNDSLRLSQMNHTRYALGTMGTNDIANTATAPQIESCFLSLMRQIRATGSLPWFGTVAPRTSSTDYFTTLANQTPTANDSVRIAFNTWLRDGAPMDAQTLLPLAAGVSSSAAVRAAFYNSAGIQVSAASGSATHPANGVFELADTVESSRNSGLWAIPAGQRTFGDGVMVAGSTTLTSATANFSASDVGGTVWSVSAFYPVGVIMKVMDAKTVVMSNPASATASNVAVTVTVSTQARSMTVEGVHPSPVGHAAMSAAGAAVVKNWTF